MNEVKTPKRPLLFYYGIALAVFFFSRSQHVILVLPIVIGIMIMIDSMFKLQMAIDLKRMGLRKWWSMLLLSIISILFADTGSF